MYFDQSKLDMGQKKPFGVTLPHDPAVVAGEVSGSSPFLTFLARFLGFAFKPRCKADAAASRGGS